MYLKRPSFRKGGPTGIDQLVPRRKFAVEGIVGGGMMEELTGGSNQRFNRLYKKPIGPTQTKFERLLYSKYPRLLPLAAYGSAAAAGTGLGQLADFYAKSTYTPEGYKRLKEMGGPNFNFDETNLDVGEVFKYIDEGNEIGQAPGFFPPGGKKKFFEDRNLDPETGLPKKDSVTDDSFAEARIKMTDTPNYEAVDFDEIVDTVVKDKKEEKPEESEDDFDSVFEKEKAKLEKALGDNDDKGMAAIALSEAIGTPGTIADKAAVLNKSLLNIMAGRKKDKKDIAKLAYTATKELEKAKIAAGKEGFSEKNYKRMVELQKIITDKTGSYSEAQKKAAQAEYDIAEKVITSISGKDSNKGFSNTDIKLLENINALVKEIKRHEGKNEAKYRAALAKFARAKAALADQPQFNNIFAIAEAEIGDTLFKKDGGRIKKQLGGGTETTAMEVSETVGQGETPTAQVSQLSFSELRNRLPKEITDDVVRLIANSNEALQDFAYIRTQGDVVKFNTKYGVNLVLPPQTA